MANVTDTPKRDAVAQQPSKVGPAPAGKPSTADAKAKPADQGVGKQAAHTAAEHEKMKGGS